MSTHSICFCGELRKISILFVWKMCISGDMIDSNLLNVVK